MLYNSPAFRRCSRKSRTRPGRRVLEAGPGTGALAGREDQPCHPEGCQMGNPRGACGALLQFAMASSPGLVQHVWPQAQLGPPRWIQSR